MSITISRNPLLLIAICLILLICIANASDYPTLASDYSKVFDGLPLALGTAFPLALALTDPVKSDQNLDIRNTLPNSDKIKGNASSRFSLEEGIPGKDLISNVTVIKTVEHGCRGPRIIITIKAPEIKEIQNEIVIALDTSGSFGKGGQSYHGTVLREVVPDILKYIEDNGTNYNISLMSWDDDIDFVSGDQTINNLPISSMLSKAKLVPIGAARAEILKQNVFDPPIHEVAVPFLNRTLNLTQLNRYVPLPQWAHSKGGSETYLHFWENESTDLNVGVLGALKILGKSGGNDTKSKKILLITGKSEFIPLNETVKSKIIESKYKIYVVGLGVPLDSQLRETLTWITSESGVKGKLYYSPGIAEWTKKSMLFAINEAIKDIMDNKRIITNVSLNESLYPYLRITSVTIDKNQIPIKYEKSDATLFNISLPEGLNASEKIEIVIDTELNMSLPIEVSENRTVVDYGVDESVGPSCVTYYWQDRKKFVVELPEMRII